MKKTLLVAGTLLAMNLSAVHYSCELSPDAYGAYGSYNQPSYTSYEDQDYQNQAPYYSQDGYYFRDEQFNNQPLPTMRDAREFQDGRELQDTDTTKNRSWWGSRSETPSEEPRSTYANPTTTKESSNSWWGTNTSKETPTAGTDDREMTRQVRDALTRSGKRFDNVTVTFSKGTVTLTGPILSEQERQEIKSRIRQVAGVRNIDDQLQVRSGTTTTQPQRGY